MNNIQLLIQLECEIACCSQACDPGALQLILGPFGSGSDIFCRWPGTSFPFSFSFLFILYNVCKTFTQDTGAQAPSLYFCKAPHPL